MANVGSSDGDIRATLALSQAEAQMGSSRTLNLPGGRQITVNIPAGVQNGEELRLPGQGEALWQGGPVGDLILTVSIPPVNPISSPSNPGFYQGAAASPNLPTEIGSAPSFSGPGSSPGYSAGSMPPTSYSQGGSPPVPPAEPTYTVPAGSGGPSGNYSPYQQQQEPLYLPQDQTAYASQGAPPYPAYPQAAQQGSYSPAPAGGQPYSYTPPPPAPVGPKRRTMTSAVIGLIFLLILLLLISSGLIYYFGVYQPKQIQNQATATANAQVSATAQANAQATARAQGTANAQASATANALATANAQASATATALQNILTRATSGTPALNDSLTGQTNSTWDELSPSQSTVSGSCAFTNSAYHSSMPTKGYFQPCYARGTPAGTLTFANFAFQVQMTITQGDEGGILFRADPTNSKFYLLRINTNGAYDVFLYVDSNGKDAKDLLSGTASSFKTGLNKQNTLAIVAQGGSLYFYVNGQYLDGASNSTFTSGLIGVFAESNTNATDVAFSNAKVWRI